VPDPRAGDAAHQGPPQGSTPATPRVYWPSAQPACQAHSLPVGGPDPRSIGPYGGRQALLFTPPAALASVLRVAVDEAVGVEGGLHLERPRALPRSKERASGSISTHPRTKSLPHFGPAVGPTECPCPRRCVCAFGGIRRAPSYDLASSLIQGISLDKPILREPTSGLEPLSYSLYE
jgi:hypothetical protein